MKVLISSSIERHLLAPIYFDYAKSLGYDIVETFYYDLQKKNQQRYPLLKLFARISPSFGFELANSQLLSDVEKFSPDIVWIFKGMEIYPKTLKLIKQKGIKLVNYNLDHPFNFISRGSGNKNVLDSFLLYDLHFTYSQEIKKEVISRFSIKNIEYLPFGFDDRIILDPFTGLRKDRICFVGFGDQQRLSFIKKILEMGYSIDLYGNNWNKLLKKPFPNLRIFSGKVGKEYYELLRSYRVQLNILRSHNFNSHNMRSFEIPSVGGIMLTDATLEHKNFFVDKSDSLLFENINELDNRLRWVFNLSSDQLNSLSYNAILNSNLKGYSYKNRVKEAFSYFKNL